MDPIFLNIGGFTIAWYGVLMTLGIVAGISIGLKLARERGLDADLFERMIYTMLLWGFIGARLMFVATSWDLFADTPFPQRLLDIINLRQGGISIHGGLLGGILAALWFTRKYKMNFYRYLDLAAPGVALGIIGGRLGNIMNGTDTVGRVTGWPIGYHWPAWARAFHDGMCIPNPDPTMDLSKYCETVGGQLVMTAPVHFTQLYGVLIGIGLLIASFYWLRSHKPGWAFWQFWLWYSLLRAGLEETFRLNPLVVNSYLSQGLHEPGIGLWTLTQIISVPLVLLSLYMLWRIASRPEPQPVAAGQVMTHAEARARGGE
ncbi:prolipoprotein diacylglyceryl transferase [Deinococcus sp. Marseille-Q6407]|uniref:prolipoprotein diacylglyceryl transferase n=1 Tax=Deinococcus sp. Marseille-Q6407 TaxID=2969223 RepID=UPI0021BFC0DD|nr:prolipoprotein diacylglyceryl transferase [Deinococcus sp. Marseille-Q6407]